MLGDQTLLPTPTGWTAAGLLQRGDRILAPDGVARVRAVRHRSADYAFEVHFADSNVVSCSPGHMWLLNDGRVVNTITLRQEHSAHSAKGRTRMMRMPGLKSLDYLPELDLSHDPYHIGRVVGTKRDIPIPVPYRRGSDLQRRAVLAGLMDAGGTYNPSRRRCSFILRDTDVAESVLELIVGFGVTPQLTLVETPNGITHRIEWTPPFNPFTRDVDVECREPQNSKTRVVVAVRGLRGGDMVDIDTDTSMVLAGRLMVPTVTSVRRTG